MRLALVIALTENCFAKPVGRTHVGCPEARMQIKPPHKGGALNKSSVKYRVYRTCFALASIAVIIEVLGAGRRF